jgi:citrate synthase
MTNNDSGDNKKSSTLSQIISTIVITLFALEGLLHGGLIKSFQQLMFRTHLKFHVVTSLVDGKYSNLLIRQMERQ